MRQMSFMDPRFMGGGAHRVLFFWHSVGNQFLTLMSNMFTNLNLTDMETGYKAFRREIIQSIKIEENRFGFEPRDYPVKTRRYILAFLRSVLPTMAECTEGKKINWKDGGVRCIVLYCEIKPLSVVFALGRTLNSRSTRAVEIVQLDLSNERWSTKNGHDVTLSRLIVLFLLLKRSAPGRHSVNRRQKPFFMADTSAPVARPGLCRCVFIWHQFCEFVDSQRTNTRVKQVARPRLADPAAHRTSQFSPSTCAFRDLAWASLWRLPGCRHLTSNFWLSIFAQAVIFIFSLYIRDQMRAFIFFITFVVQLTSIVLIATPSFVFSLAS